MTVSIAFLGGLGEIGRNCAVLEVDGRLALIDCGLMFPDEDMLGVDLVLPDFTSILERPDDLECVVITHGHEDHIGSLGYLLREVNVPVFGTSLSVELARSRLEELGVAPQLHPVEKREWMESGPFRFALIGVAHSVPQATGVVFDTPEGLIMHSGDFKLDPTPVDGQPTDLATFAGFGRQGVRLLLADSTNAERPGFVPSEATVGPKLNELVAGATGRVIIACFASHVHRVQQAVDAVLADDRHFALLGRSMLRNVEVATGLGLLQVPDERVKTVDELLEMDSGQTAVICTGSQGEPFAALSLMASGEHRSIKLEAGDTVILSATPIPGNETKVSRVINNLLRQDVAVFHGRNAPVHVSGHAAQEELKTFYNVIAPQSLIPVHGEYRHLVANAAVAREVGIEDVHVCEDGDRVVLENGTITVQREALPAGLVYLDGSGIGDVEAVLRDRRHLADDGVIVVTVGLDMHSGKILIGPDVDSHGVTGDSEEIHKLVADRIIEAIGDLDLPTDLDTVRRTVRSATGRKIKQELRRRPVVYPVVIEV
jgi:ribonuclease J